VSGARVVAALVLALVVAPVAASVGTPAAAQVDATAADGISAVGERTLAGLESCLRTDRRVGVALVIDETRTLQRTDPAAVRADALVQFVRRLRELTARTGDGAARELWLNVSFFGAGSTTWQDWTLLRPDDAGFEDRLRAEIVARDDSGLTLFERAVAPAADALSALTLRLGTEGLCTFALWFSDGELDPDDRASLGPDRPAMREAIDVLCRPGGVADTFRSGPGALVGLLLNVDAGAATAPTVGMREIVEGDGPGGRCGTLAADGVFLEGDLSALLRLLERVAVGVPDATLTGDPLRITVDPGVARLRLVGAAPSGLRIVTAAGRELDVAPGGAGTGALADDADVRWAGGTVIVDVAVGGDHGTWTVRRDGVTSRMDLYLFGDLALEVDRDRSVLLRGAPSEIVASITGPAGPPGLGRLGSVAVGVELRGGEADRSVEPFADGSVRVPVRLDGPDAQLDATLTLRTTTVSGATLQPVIVRTSLAVTLPDEFPTATLREPRYAPALQRTGDTAAVTVDLEGSAVGPTRVCPEPTTVAGDGAVEAVAPDVGEDGCVALGTGERRSVQLEVRLVEPSLVVRELDAPVTLRLVSAVRDGAPPLELETRLAATVPVDRTPPSRSVFVALLVAGIVVPWRLLWLLADRAAVLLPSRGLRLAHIDAVLHPGPGDGAPRLERADGSDPIVTGDDFGYASALPGVGGERPGREWRVTGGQLEGGPGPLGETVRAVRPGAALRPPSARVDAPPGMRIVTSVGDVSPVRAAGGGGRGRRGGGVRGGQRGAARSAAGTLTLDGAIHLLVADRDLRGPEDAPVPVRLTVLVVAEGRTLDRRAAELDRAAGALVDPTTLATLRAAVAEGSAADAAVAPAAAAPAAAAPAAAAASGPASGPASGAAPSTGEGRDPGDDPWAADDPWPDDDLQLDDL
jgi:hypothetical protein